VAKLTIRLVRDAVSGKRNVVIGYESDSDALPIEHEEEHRRLVEKLVAGGLVKKGELGEIVVERGTPVAAAETPAESAPAAKKSVDESQ